MLNNEVAGLESNSYVSVVEADNYFSLHELEEKWNEIQNKDKYLVSATRHIDTLLYVFDKYDKNQALEFPRTDNLKDNQPFIPLDVKKACFEQAIFIYLNPDLWIHKSHQDIGQDVVQTGVETFSYKNKVKDICSEARKYLRKYEASLEW